MFLKTMRTMASFGQKICYLRSLREPGKRIELPDQQLVVLGRNEQTGIQDLNVSRSHLECKADFASSKVFVTHVGKSFSGCNGYALLKASTYFLVHGDLLEVLLGNHEFEVVFEVIPEEFPSEADLEAPIYLTNSWEQIDGKELLLFTRKGSQSRNRIAAFDLDGTIIKTRSGARFPKDRDDWAFNFDNIVHKLRELDEQGMKIVIFSNQSGVGKDNKKIADFKYKIESVTDKLNVPIQVFIALGKSGYRKPNIGMWMALCNVKNDGIQVSIGDSFYVGDAAGRPINWAPRKKKDHSLADRLFALNLGLRFYTPEEYFLNTRPVNYVMPDFDPRNVIITPYPDLNLKDKHDVIILVGSQGSGKSHFCQTQLAPYGYHVISRDKLGNWKSCVKALEQSLLKNQCAVIDNTNPDKESRKRYLQVAAKYGVNCRCFVMTTGFKQCKHNIKYRELTDKSHNIVNDMLLNVFKKSYQEPELSEGFAEIVKINFVPVFPSKEFEKLYKMFLLES